MPTEPTAVVLLPAQQAQRHKEVRTDGDSDGIRETTEILQKLRKKDDNAHSLQNALEAERRQRRQLQAEASAEKASLHERFEQTEAELSRRLQAQEVLIEERREEHHAEIARLKENLEAARAREIELLHKNEALAKDLRTLLSRAEVDAAEMLALRARVDALAADLGDTQRLLRTSDEVQSRLQRELREKEAALEQARAELREVHLLERSGREQSQVQCDRLSAQCESVTRQLQEKSREADVLREGLQRVEEAMRVKGVDCERSLNEIEERRKEVENRRARCEAEAGALRDELKVHAASESKLRESIAAWEVQVEDHKKEGQRLRQELFRQQTLVDERDLAVQAGKSREQQLSNTIATLEERLRSANAEGESRQTALHVARTSIQKLELEAIGHRDGYEALQKELSRARAAEADSCQEVARRLEQKISHSEAEIKLLQDQLGERKEDLCKRVAELDAAGVAVAKAHGELAAAHASHEVEIRSRDETASRLHSDLRAAGEKHHHLEMTLETSKRDLDSHREQASRRETQLVSEAAAAETALQEARAKHAEAMAKEVRQRSLALVVAEESVQTSPRLLPAPDPFLEEREAWGSEIAALHRTVESLQAQVKVAVPLVDKETDVEGLEVDPVRLTVRRFIEPRINAFERRVLLCDIWRVWAEQVHVAATHAKLERAVADECRLATESAARERGISDSLKSRSLGTLNSPEEEPTLASLKRLALEFRQRVMAAIVDTLPGTSPRESRAALVGSLDHGRRCFGRLFHAAFFLYQKLRALVPSELKEPLQDPLSKVVPIPFYVLPYKTQIAVKRGAAAVAQASNAPRGGSSAVLHVPSRRPSKTPPPCPSSERLEERMRWFEARIAELEEGLPLASVSLVEVPHFIARLLDIWAQADARTIAGRTISGAPSEPLADPTQASSAVEAQMRDRLDVLLADALTVYMSAWRIAPSPQETAEYTARTGADRVLLVDGALPKVSSSYPSMGSPDPPPWR